MSFLSKLAALIPKKVLARIAYNSFLQSPFGKKCQRWIPLIATGGYVAVIALKIGGAGGAESALDMLHSLNIQPGVSEAEITLALGGFGGLVNKMLSIYFEAKGEMVPPNSAPVIKTEDQFESFNKAYNKLRTAGVGFTEARELALKQILATAAPTPASAKALKKESKADRSAAIEDPAKEPKV